YRVYAVNTTLNKGTFTPADYLTTETNVYRCFTDVIVRPHKGIQQFRATTSVRLGTVNQWLKAGAAIHNFGIVPGTSTEEGAVVLVFQLQVTTPLEHVGVNITFFVVQGAVVVVIGRTLTYDTHRSAVTRHNLAGVWLFSTPCHTVADVIVDLNAELTKIKFNGVDSGGT